MTPRQLRAAAERAGGAEKLAALIGKKRLFIQNRLTPCGKRVVPISRMDELAILAALGLESVGELTSRALPPGSRSR